MIFQGWTRLSALCLLAAITIITNAHAQNNETFFRDGFWFKWDSEGRINSGGVLSSSRETEIQDFHAPDLRGTPGTSIPFNFMISGRNLKWKPQLIIQGLPDGFKLNNGTFKESLWFLNFEELVNIQLISPKNYEGKFQLKLALYSDADESPTLKTISVDIKKQYNITQFAIENIVGKPGETIPVTLRIPNNIPQKNIQIIFRGLPETFSLNAGSKKAALWSLTVEDLKDLKLQAPAKYKGEFLLEVFFFKNKRTRPQRKLISVIIGKD